MSNYKWEYEPEEINSLSHHHSPHHHRTKKKYKSDQEIIIYRSAIYFSPLERIGPSNKRKQWKNDKNSEIGRIEKMPPLNTENVFWNNSEKSCQNVENEDVCPKKKWNPKSYIDTWIGESPLFFTEIAKEHIKSHTTQKDDTQLGIVKIKSIKQYPQIEYKHQKYRLIYLGILWKWKIDPKIHIFY